MERITKKTTITLILKHTYVPDEELSAADSELEDQMEQDLCELFTMEYEDAKVEVMHVDVEHKDWLEQ